MTLRSRLLATGIRRSGGPRNGYRYRHADGHPVSVGNVRRIAALRIPAAWAEVAIAPTPGEKVQAIGRDAAGRWQYLYRRSHAKRRSRAKFDRLIAFGGALPQLRRSLAHDLARSGLPREKVVAGALLLLAASAMRPGSEVYAEENATFGLATLRASHVEVEGDRIQLRFRGKRGLVQRHELRSRRLARLIVAMNRLPGQELFRYRDAEGTVRDLRRQHLNDYVQEAMGGRFSARDFRTWMGTLICAAALRAEHDVPPAARERAIMRALRRTAARLGNTVEVAREAYVHPAILDAFRAGRVVAHGLSSPETLIERRALGLDRSERALIAMLRKRPAGVHR